MIPDEHVPPGEPVASGEAMISKEEVEKAIEALVRDHEPAIMGYLRGTRKLLYHIAEEAFNDVLVVMAERVRQGKPTHKPRAYMRVVAKNAAIDRLVDWYAGGIPSKDLAEPGPDSDDMLDSVEISEVLRQAIRELKPDFRRVVELRYLRDFSEADTATILNIRPGTVSSRLNTAKRQLRKLLHDEGIVRRSSPTKSDTTGRRDI